MHLGALDLAILAAYFALTVAIGVRAGRRTTGARDYLLGSRDLPWWALLLSIVATETSTVTFLSVPGLAYGGFPGTTGDFRFLQVALGYIVGRLLVVRWLLPMYFRGELLTAYELLNARFGGAVRKLASLLFLVTRTLADGLRLYLTALVLRALLPIDLTTAVLLMGAFTIVYTWFGGMRAVVWTDVLQFVVYMAGAVIALFVLANALPDGFATVLETGAENDKFRTFDFGWAWNDPYTFWVGLVGGAVLSLGSHGVDQLLVQRYLAAKDRRDAALALSLSGVVVFVQFAFFLLLGVALFAFYRAHPPPAPFEASDAVFLDFIVRHTPEGVRGLVLGAVFSAAMSTLSSSLNSSASALVNDLVLPLRGLPPNDVSALRLAKGATLLFGVLQIAVGASGLGLDGRAVVEQVLGIASLTAGLLLGVYALGTFTRVRQRDAIVGLCVGALVDAVLKFGVPGLLAPSGLAGLWYGLVGSGTTFLAGALAAAVSRPR